MEGTKPCRSWLFTPGIRPDRFEKAGEVGADILIIDLEDAVSAADKPRARQMSMDYLAVETKGNFRRTLRINGLDTLAGVADVNALFGSKADPDFILLPKTETLGHLLILDRLLTASGKSARLVGLIESAQGLSRVEEVANATPRLFGLMLGAADMAADLGATVARAPLAMVRSRLVAACALAGIVPIDSPCFDIQETDALKADVDAAIAFGFVAKAAVHPSQIGPINTALTPTKEDVEHAKRVLSANESGVGLVDGQMVDEAVARKARRILVAASAS